MPLTDTAPYRRYVEHFDLTEDQKSELIQMVWNIMEGCADRAFGKDAMQLAGLADHDRLQSKQDRVISQTEQQSSGVSKLLVEEKHGHETKPPGFHGREDVRACPGLTPKGACKSIQPDFRPSRSPTNKG